MTSVTVLVFSILLTYFVCRWSERKFYDSWVSSSGEMVVAGAILGLQIHFIKDISRLIAEANLDLVPVTSTFCRNLSVVGFIFLVQCGDVGIHLISYLYNGKTKEEQNESNSTYFLVLGISV